MPIVPQYSNPQVQAQGLPNVSVGAQAPLEAFGGGQSAANVENASENVAEVGRNIAIEEKQRADQVMFMNGDRQASELQTGLMVKLNKMKGQDAFGAPDVIAQQWQDGVKQISAGLVNRQQQLAFEKAATGRWDELNRATQFHVASEQKIFDEDQTKSYIETSKNAAVVGAKDDQLVQNELERQGEVIKQWAARQGLSGTDSEKTKIAEVTSGTIRDVIGARIDAGDTKGAIQFLGDHKDSMVAADVLHSMKAVEEGKTLDAGMKEWGTVKSFMLADGVPDEARMEAHIMANPDLSDKEKVQVTSFVKARAREEVGNKNREDASTERQFMNTIVSGRQQGVTLENALKVANRYGRDDYDKAVKSEAVRKMYAPPEKSDPATYISLWERINEKNVDKADIDQGMQTSMINAQDWRTLRELYFKVNSDGKNEKEQQVYERVKILAQETFGSDKSGAEKFMYDLHQNNKDKDPSAIWKDANDKLQKDPKTGFSMFGWNTGLFRDPVYKADVDKLDAQNLAWGKLHQDIGRKEVNAIGQGVLYQAGTTGKKSWSVGDVNDFAQAMGGYDKIKQGTPGNNAIQFLVRHNKLVTPANVKAVLERSNLGDNN